MTRTGAILTAILLARCGTPPAPMIGPIEVLTRDGCANTDVLRRHLDDALKALSMATAYAVVDLDTLPSTDARKAYPTPTLLYKGVDLFGMEQPNPANPGPT